MKLEEDKCPYQVKRGLYPDNVCLWLEQNDNPLYFCNKDCREHSYTKCYMFLEKWFHDTQDYYE